MSIKFNDENGTADQQVCQNSCDISDPHTGAVGRVDWNGVPFDVYYVDFSGTPVLSENLGKCEECPYWLNFVASS